MLTASQKSSTAPVRKSGERFMKVDNINIDKAKAIVGRVDESKMTVTLQTTNKLLRHYHYPTAKRPLDWQSQTSIRALNRWRGQVFNRAGLSDRLYRGAWTIPEQRTLYRLVRDALVPLVTHKDLDWESITNGLNSVHNPHGEPVSIKGMAGKGVAKQRDGATIGSSRLSTLRSTRGLRAYAMRCPNIKALLQTKTGKKTKRKDAEMEVEPNAESGGEESTGDEENTGKANESDDVGADVGDGYDSNDIPSDQHWRKEDDRDDPGDLGGKRKVGEPNAGRPIST